MIIIAKLTTGEEIIGKVNNEIHEQCDMEGPMLIVGSRDDQGGALKLRDFFLLSEETSFTIPADMILITYTPTEVMQEYYKKAIYYSWTHTKLIVEDQIKHATMELDNYIAEESKESSRLLDILGKISGSRLN